MEKNKTVSQQEHEDFIYSFAIALDRLDKRIKVSEKPFTDKFLKVRRAYVKANKWNAEWVATQFILVAGKISELPTREREVVMAIGHMAKEIYDKEIDNTTNDNNGTERNTEE